MNLDGARALVTGGASGIGAACVEQLRDAGAVVAVLDLSAPTVASVFIACDISDEDQVSEGIARAAAELGGGLDLAVLNAGVGGFAPLTEMSLAEWDRVLGVNLRGTFLTLREVARAMTATSGGSIVVTSSTSGSLVERQMSHYNVSKAAVNQLVRVAARELGPVGIRVNGVAPGPTRTPLFAQTELLAGYWDKLRRRTALGQIGTAAHIAQAILAVAALEWVTGQVLIADGGISLWSPIDPFEEES